MKERLMGKLIFSSGHQRLFTVINKSSGETYVQQWTLMIVTIINKRQLQHFSNFFPIVII